MATAAELRVLVQGDTAGVEGALGKTEGMVSKLTGTLGKVGLASMGIGAITGAAGSALGAVGGLISSAESLGDAQARTNIVFGEASSAVQASASAQANALGMTREAYLAAAGATGDLATSLGVSKSAAAGMASGLTELAPKLAAYTGAETGAVSDAFEKALAGKTKGLQALGVAITDADVKQTAMSMHVEGDPKKWDSATRAQVMYQAILNKTTGAQSAWADNSGDVEVSMQRLNAAMDDAKATIGEKLLPVIAPLVQQLADALPGAISTVVGWLNQAKPIFDGVVGFFKEHPQITMFATVLGGLAGVFGTIMAVVGPFIPIITGIGSVIGTVVSVAGPALGLLATLFNPVGLAIGAVVLAVAGLKLAWDNNLGGIQEKVGAVVAWIQEAWDGFVGFLSEKKDLIVTILLAIVTGGLSLVVQGFLTHKDQIVQTITELGSSIQSKWTEFTTTIQTALSNIGSAITSKWSEFKSAITDALSSIYDNIRLKWDAFLREITDKLQAILGAVQTAWEGVKTAIAEAMDLVKTTLTDKWEQAKQTVSDALDRIRQVVTDVFNRAKEIVSEAMGIVRQVISDVISHVTTLFREWGEFVRGVVDAFKRLISGDFAGAFETMKQTVQRGIDAVIGFFRGMGESIKTAIGNAATLLLEVGSDLISGIRKGVSDAWTTFVDWFIGLLKGIPAAALRAILGGSPALVMVPVGGSLAEGVHYGAEQFFEDHPFAKVIGEWYRLGSLSFFRATDFEALYRGMLPRDMFTIGGFAGTPGRRGGSIMPGYTPTPGGLGVSDAFIGLMRSTNNPITRAMGEFDKLATFLRGLMTGLSSGGSGTTTPGGGGLGGPAGYTGVPRRPGGIDASAFRTGRGGFIAASKTNYWKTFVDKYGVPSEESARKTASALGIPIPSWLEAIWAEMAEAGNLSRGGSFLGGAGASAGAGAIAPVSGIEGGTRAVARPIAGPGAGGPGTPITGPLAVSFRPTMHNTIMLDSRIIGEAIVQILPEQTFRAITAPQGG